MECVGEQTRSSVPSGKQDIQHLITELPGILDLVGDLLEADVLAVLNVRFRRHLEILVA